MIETGSRVLAAIRCATSWQKRAAVPQPYRRDADALAEHLLARHVEGARHAAADIGPVAVRLGEGDRSRHPTKIGRISRTSGKCVPPAYRIVDGVDVARLHLALEGADHVLAGVVQRADVDGDVVIALGDRNRR